MLHRNRIWTVHEVESSEELSKQLVGHSWTLCTGFYVSGYNEYVFVNDATSEDALQEYAVLKRVGTTFHQIESVTVSWCSDSELLELIRRILAGEFDDEHWTQIDARKLQSSAEHGTCPLCA